MSKPQQRRRGRPRKGSGERKAAYLDVRLESTEKEAFQQAAALSSLPLSAWVRERLRRAAIHELEEFGIPIPFLNRACEADR